MLMKEKKEISDSILNRYILYLIHTEKKCLKSRTFSHWCCNRFAIALHYTLSVCRSDHTSPGGERCSDGTRADRIVKYIKRLLFCALPVWKSYISIIFNKVIVYHKIYVEKYILFVFFSRNEKFPGGFHHYPGKGRRRKKTSGIPPQDASECPSSWSANLHS